MIVRVTSGYFLQDLIQLDCPSNRNLVFLLRPIPAPPIPPVASNLPAGVLPSLIVRFPPFSFCRPAASAALFTELLPSSSMVTLPSPMVRIPAVLFPRLPASIFTPPNVTLAVVCSSASIVIVLLVSLLLSLCVMVGSSSAASLLPCFTVCFPSAVALMVMSPSSIYQSRASAETGRETASSRARASAKSHLFMRFPPASVSRTWRADGRGSHREVPSRCNGVPHCRKACMPISWPLCQVYQISDQIASLF